jgi:hypothetical protein
MSAERVVAEGVYEAKRLMKSEAEPVKTPAMRHDRAPRSPPHKTEISDGDVMEVVDDKMADWANNVNAKFVTSGMPMDFLGNTCKQVCTMCAISAEDYPECGCKATCVAGPDDTKCSTKIHGWSNEDINTPSTRWKAKCNAGGTDCKECLDKKVQDKMHKCKNARIPEVCEHELKVELSKPDTPVIIAHKTILRVTAWRLATNSSMNRKRTVGLALTRSGSVRIPKQTSGSL